MKRLAVTGRHFRMIEGAIQFVRDYLAFKKMAGHDTAFPVPLGELYPCLYDRYAQAGNYLGHYFYQDLWASRKVLQSGVSHHYDIGSRLDGFIAQCLTFCEVTMLDIRPLDVKVKNLNFVQANCTNMPHVLSNSITSLSTLHAVEHFGLGRYGDPINPCAYKQAISEIKRVIAVNGDVYFSVPIGKQRVQFNAHRVFSPGYVLDLFDGFDLKEFSAVNDNGELVECAELDAFVDANYACGLFHFRNEVGVDKKRC